MTRRRGADGSTRSMGDRNTLRIAHDVALPLDAITQWTGILGKRRSGKTTVARVMIEDVLESQAAPVLVLDPTDAYPGLRSSADGNSEGYPITVFGGRYGDVPIEGTRACGEAIARIVLDQRISAIVSLRNLINTKERGELIAGLAQTLYHLNHDPFFLVIDEANLLLPEGGSGGAAADALRALVLQGGSSGFGGAIISQRPQLVEKSVLNQIDTLVIMQMMGAAERRAIDNWIDKNASSEKRAEILRSLATLKQGEGWIWSPNTLGILKRTHFRKPWTFDSSATPKAGVRRLEPTATAKLDLSGIRQRLAATIKHAEESDPDVLRRRVRELESRAPEPEIRYLTPPALLAALDSARQQLEVIGEHVRGAAEALTAAASSAAGPGSLPTLPATSPPPRDGQAATAVNKDDVTPTDPELSSVAKRGWETRRANAEKRSAVAAAAWKTRRSRAANHESTSSPPGDGTIDESAVRLKAGAIRMLERLASAPRSLTRRELGMLAEVSGRTLIDYLAMLRAAGYIREEGSRVELTQPGRERVPNAPALPTWGELLQAYSKDRRIKSGALRMLQALIESYPEPLPRRDLGERSRVVGRTLLDYISALRRAGLAEDIPGRGTRVVDAFFLGSPEPATSRSAIAGRS